MPHDPFTAMKAAARESWATFGPNAMFTTKPAATLVEWASVQRDERVLDVGCGTGVVAVTAAMRGAVVTALDLSPVLLDEARRNAAISELPMTLLEGDCEQLPFADQSFDVVMSQFGHMFAPRPEVAIAEMLRVLRQGGRIAFSTWPPELLMGRMFDLFAKFVPPPHGAALPSSWGTAQVVRERLGSRVRDVEFGSGEMHSPALSPAHFRARMEQGSPPLLKAIASLHGDEAAIARLRREVESIAVGYFRDNCMTQAFLMTRAVKV
jgi:SAM-dependent methyltransferase